MQSGIFLHPPPAYTIPESEFRERTHHLPRSLHVYTNANMLKLGPGRFLSNVNNGARLWVAAAGPGYHSGRHHHKVRPTSPTSNLRPRKARKRPPLEPFFAGENFNQFANRRPAAAQRGMWPFFCKARRANSKIKGGEGAMAAWECS